MITVFSNTGRDLGTNKFPDYDMGVHSKPTYNPTDVESKFKDLSMEMNRKNEVIEEQRKQLEEKDRIIEELRLRYEVNEPDIQRKVVKGGRPPIFALIRLILVIVTSVEEGIKAANESEVH